MLDKLRLFIAAVLVYIILILFAVLASGALNSGDLLFLAPPIAVITAAILLLLRWFRPTTQNTEQWKEELESKGLLLSNSYSATRAFQVEEFEDEGNHYFLELVDGSVLFLSGQALYEYEPIVNDPELNQPRCFPCSEFTVRSHRIEKYLVDILCRGEILEPEIVAPPFDEDDFKSNRVPDTGDIIRDRAYDVLKRERLKVDINE